MHNRGNDYGNMCLCMGWVFYIKLSRSVLGYVCVGVRSLGGGERGRFAWVGLSVLQKKETKK